MEVPAIRHATAFTVHESAVTWKLHHDKGRSRQDDGKSGGCSVTGDREGEGCHLAPPRSKSQMVESLHQLPGWVGTGWGADRLCDEDLVLHLGRSTEGREAYDLTGWANGQ